MTEEGMKGSLLAALASTFAIGGGVLHAEDAPASKTWTNKTELAYVLTAGNSESSTLGFKNDFERIWEKNTLRVKAAAIRVESTRFDRFVVTDVGGSVIVTEETTETTAEGYLLNARYERKIDDRFFWYLGAGWDRDRFAGIEDRYIGEAGAGNSWVASDSMKWKTYYAATYTDETDTLEISDSYAGARLGSDFFWKFTANAEYQNVTDFYWSFADSDDWRADVLNSLAVGINKSLALKASLLWKYRNQPAEERFAIDATPEPDDFLTYEFDKLDTIFTTSLVVNF